MINDFILLLLLVKHGAFQHLQKSQLQLFRLQIIHIIEGMTKGLVIFIGQPCDQIQMLMDVFPCLDLFHDASQFFKIHIAVDGSNGMGVCRLYTDLKLEQPFSYLFQIINGFLIDDIRRDLEMEICHTVIMFMEIFPYSHGMAFLAVKGSVDKFHLRHPCIQKFLQVWQYFFQRNKTHPLLYRREAIATLIGTAAGGFIVNDLILDITEIRFIREWQQRQIQRFLLYSRTDFSILTIGQTADFGKVSKNTVIPILQ